MAESELSLPIEAEVAARLDAWRIAIDDAIYYIAVARNENEVVFSRGSWVKSEAGWVNIEHAVSKGMISAAIISTCQVFALPGQGDGQKISSNKNGTLNKIRRMLYEHSDEMNNWAPGKSEVVIQHAIATRNQFLAHFDGKSANIQERESSPEAGGLLVKSWRPPNPWFIPDAFRDLEAVLITVHHCLRHLRGAQVASTEIRNG